MAGVLLTPEKTWVERLEGWLAAEAGRAWWVLGLLVLVVYAGAFSRELVFDAAIVVGTDPRLQALNGENLRNLWTQQYWWPTIHSDAWRPLTNFTFLLEYAVLGFRDHPLGYQVVNALLHTLNAGLVWLLGRALGLRRVVALAGAALFAAHPLGTEAVANIVGRSDLLATAGVLGGLLLVLRPAGDALGLRRGCGLAACGLLAVLGKENGVVLFGIVVGLALIRGLNARDPTGLFVRPRRWTNQVAAPLALLPALAVFVASRVHFARFTTGIDNVFVDNPLHELGFVAGRLTALRVLADNAGQLLAPLGLSADYSFNAIPLARGDFSGATDLIGAATFVALVLLGALMTWRVRRDPVVAFLAGAAFTAYFPTSNLLLNIGSIRADRFLYLPLAFVAPLAVLLCARLWALAATRADLALLRRVLPPALAAWSVALVVLAHVRGHDWRDNYVLWDSAVAVAPNSFKAVAARGKARSDLDQSESSLRATIEDYRRAQDILDEAQVPPLLRSLQVYSDQGANFVTLADVVEKDGRAEEAAALRAEAEREFRRALELEAPMTARWLAERREKGLGEPGERGPVNALLRRNYAALLLRLERPAEAVALLEPLVARYPLDGLSRYALVRALAAAGEWERALEERVLLSVMEPEDASAGRDIVDLLARRSGPDFAAAGAPAGVPVQLDLDDPVIAAQVSRALDRYAAILAEQGRSVQVARVERARRLVYGQ
jgi:tetratricopeptide (TPR) repeat protein